MAAHINRAGHFLIIIVIEKLHKKDSLLRKLREYGWSISLQTAALHGVNLRKDHLKILCTFHSSIFYLVYIPHLVVYNPTLYVFSIHT